MLRGEILSTPAEAFSGEGNMYLDLRATLQAGNVACRDRLWGECWQCGYGGEHQGTEGQDAEDGQCQYSRVTRRKHYMRNRLKDVVEEQKESQQRAM